MTKKEIEELDVLRNVFLSTEGYHDLILSQNKIDYFGVLLLKEQVMQLKEMISDYEKIEEYEACVDLQKDLTELTEAIKESELCIHWNNCEFVGDYDGVCLSSNNCKFPNCENKT